MGMLNSIVDQTSAAAGLLERASQAASQTRALRSGDRVYTPLIVSAEFDQGVASAANLVFNVPADTDFWAYRFMLYPYCKTVDPAGGASPDLVFRPTTWTSQPYSPGFLPADGTNTDIHAQVDAVFAFVFDGKEIQNANIPAAAAYSSTMEKWGARSGPTVDFAALLSGISSSFRQPQWCGATQTPSGMVFPVPMFIPRGKSLTCRVTPTFLAKRVSDTRQNRYKIVGVLEGEKRVGAMR